MRTHSITTIGAMLFCFSIASFAADTGTLHTDGWGNVYSGRNPFPVALVDSLSEGPLHVNVFGEVFVGNDPFPIGEIDNHGQEGELHNDVFGDTYIGDSPFRTDITPLKKKAVRN